MRKTLLTICCLFACMNINYCMDKSIDQTEVVVSAAFIALNIGIISIDLQTTYAVRRYCAETPLTKEISFINPFSSSAISSLISSMDSEIDPFNRSLLRKKGLELTGCAAICMYFRNKVTVQAIKDRQNAIGKFHR